MDLGGGGAGLGPAIEIGAMLEGRREQAKLRNMCGLLSHRKLSDVQMLGETRSSYCRSMCAEQQKQAV